MTMMMMMIIIFTIFIMIIIVTCCVDSKGLVDGYAHTPGNAIAELLPHHQHIYIHTFIYIFIYA